LGGETNNSISTDVIGAGFSWKFTKKWRFFLELIYLNVDFEEEDFLMINSFGFSWFSKRHKIDFGFSPLVGEFNLFSDDPRTGLIPVPIFSYSIFF
jgi:hypothetical protein